QRTRWRCTKLGCPTSALGVKSAVAGWSASDVLLAAVGRPAFIARHRSLATSGWIPTAVPLVANPLINKSGFVCHGGIACLWNFNDLDESGTRKRLVRSRGLVPGVSHL